MSEAKCLTPDCRNVPRGPFPFCEACYAAHAGETARRASQIAHQKLHAAVDQGVLRVVDWAKQGLAKLFAPPPPPP